MINKSYTIKIKKLSSRESFSIPSYATKHSAGLDLSADISEEIIISSGQFKLIPTGIAIELQEGLEAQIRPRSGLALKNGITVLNSPGTIDADYRGEIGVILINHSKEEFKVQPGMRIAQMVICSFIQAEFEQVNELSGSERGKDGFGSTGT